MKKELAKLSEEGNYEMKNRQRHQNRTMMHAKKERMPIDKAKVKDLLRN